MLPWQFIKIKLLRIKITNTKIKLNRNIENVNVALATN